MDSLQEYRKKRRLKKTPEPAAMPKASRSGNLFVVQKHRATQLHYDFRLEADRVLKSWSIPKGPSVDPTVKRFAVAVEDHPVDYGRFEGVIPEGEYGAGTVMVWDRGTYVPEDGADAAPALRKGKLALTLRGRKLKGRWALVRMGGRRRWLLMKQRDRYASKDDITLTAPRSVLSRRTLARIAADDGGDVEKAATGDPPKSARRR